MNEEDILDRLHKLADRLTECLADAERIRARVTKAHDANAWPDVRLASRGCADTPDPHRVRPADDNRRRH